MKLTCMFGGYNEAHRIPGFMAHASKWADEIIYVDKSSPDGSAQLAHDLGAKVIEAPFSRAGKESMGDHMNAAKNDWVFVLTPGEVPTRKLLSEIDKLLELSWSEIDLILIPKKLYSFGLHDTDSPWSVSYQPFLVNRHRAHFSKVIHHNFGLKPGREKNLARIQFSDDCHVLHPTHATVEGFLKSHCDYILSEAECTPREQCENKIREAYVNMNNHQFGGPKYSLVGQHAAWNFYWSGVALAAFEKFQQKDTPALYRNMTDTALKEWL